MCQCRQRIKSKSYVPIVNVSITIHTDVNRKKNIIQPSNKFPIFVHIQMHTHEYEYEYLLLCPIQIIRFASIKYNQFKCDNRINSTTNGRLILFKHKQTELLLFFKILVQYYPFSSCCWNWRRLVFWFCFCKYQTNDNNSV